jgi:hypothetical protein
MNPASGELNQENEGPTPVATNEAERPEPKEKISIQISQKRQAK